MTSVDGIQRGAKRVCRLRFRYSDTEFTSPAAVSLFNQIAREANSLKLRARKRGLHLRQQIFRAMQVAIGCELSNEHLQRVAVEMSCCIGGRLNMVSDICTNCARGQMDGF